MKPWRTDESVKDTRRENSPRGSKRGIVYVMHSDGTILAKLSPSRRADAQLMAKAPELLNVLRDLLEWIPHQTSCATQVTERDDGCDCDLARAERLLLGSPT